MDPYGLCAEENTSGNWEQVKGGIKGIAWGVAQILGGLSITQFDSPAPGPLDVIGAGIAVNGTGDVMLGYADVVGGLMGVDTSDVPDSFINATGDSILGNDEAGDVIENIYNTGFDCIHGTSKP